MLSHFSEKYIEKCTEKGNWSISHIFSYYNQGGKILHIKHDFNYDFDGPEYLQCMVRYGAAENLFGAVRCSALYSCLATL